MKQGYINSSFMKIIFTGAGGVGKTHTVCLICGEDPPDPNCRKSTDCADKAVTLRVDATNDEKWEVVDEEMRQKIIAKGVCAAEEDAKLKREQQQRTTTPLNQQKPPKQSHLESETTGEQSQQSKQKFEMKQKPQEESQPKPPHSTKKPMQPLETQMELIKKIHEAILSGEVSGEIKGTKWVYVVDTGGQPPFHELLSAFIKGASVCAFVFKLSENLDTHPLVEYWLDGNAVGEPFTHPLSNRQILEQGIHTIEALPGLSDEDPQSPILIAIGTHRDEQDKCKDETLEQKDKTLHEIMKQSSCNIQYNTHSGVEKVVFDVNAKNPEPRDKIIASTLRRVIANRMPKPTPIPLRHYGLELELEHLANTKGVITMKECRTIGDKLNFDEKGLKAALRFLHKLNAVLYYPQIKEIKELVFCNPLVVIKIVSKVVEHIYRVKYQQVPVGATIEWKESCEKGIIKIEQFKTREFDHCFRRGVFTPESLFKLFEHLLIVAKINEEDQQYFMPCLLDESTESRRLPSENFSPLAFQFHKKNKPVYAPCGLFSALVAFLLSSRNQDPKGRTWEIAIATDSDYKLFKNNIRFHSFSPPAVITLVNFRTSFEVYAECRQNRDLPQIRSTIVQGLKEAKKVRNFDHVVYSEAFACKCPVAQNKPHLADVDTKEKSWCCPRNPIHGGSLGPTELVWYEEISTSMSTVCLVHTYYKEFYLEEGKNRIVITETYLALYDL